MSETIFLGGCPVIRPEGIYYDGRRVIRLGMGSVGLGDVGDLLAYRQEWDAFIGAHLALWRRLNALLESSPTAQQCPSGIFDAGQIKDHVSFCTTLSLTRRRTSSADPGGILTQWNAWKDKSSADIVAGAASMLKWHQEVVMLVGGRYKDELLQYTSLWGLLDVQLPDLPSFSTQQEIRARIEGAYISTKGVIQLLGYGVGETLGMASDVAQAVAQGLTDTAKALPQTVHWAGIALAVAAVVVGGALIVYYVPRRQSAPQPAP